MVNSIAPYRLSVYDFECFPSDLGSSRSLNDRDEKLASAKPLSDMGRAVRLLAFHVTIIRGNRSVGRVLSRSLFQI